MIALAYYGVRMFMYTLSVMHILVSTVCLYVDAPFRDYNRLCRTLTMITGGMFKYFSTSGIIFFDLYYWWLLRLQYDDWNWELLSPSKFKIILPKKLERKIKNQIWLKTKSKSTNETMIKECSVSAFSLSPYMNEYTWVILS